MWCGAVVHQSWGKIVENYNALIRFTSGALIKTACFCEFKFSALQQSMQSGNPNDVALTPLERAWKKDEADRLKEEQDLAKAMALRDEDITVKVVAPVDNTPKVKYANEHRLVKRYTIKPTFIDKTKLTQEEYHVQKADLALFSIRWSPDNRLIATGSASGRIAIYDGKTGHTRYSCYSQKLKGRHQGSTGESISVGEAESIESGEHVGLIPSLSKSIVNPLDAATVTAIRWRPTNTWDKDGHYTLLSANSAGKIQHWKVSSPYDLEDNMQKDVSGQGTDGMKCVSSLTVGTGLASAGICLDYDMKGKRFAVGCKDAVVRLYDEETQQLTHTLNGGEGVAFEVEPEHLQHSDRGWYGSGNFIRSQLVKESAMEIINKGNIKVATKALNNEKVVTIPRHTNRVYSCKFTTGHTSPIDHLVLSSGWDRTLQVWDMRVPGPAVKSFFGAYLAGDAMDVMDNTICTGSHRQENQLQLWDLRYGGEPVSLITLESNLMLAAGFSRGNTEMVSDRFVCAGGMGAGPNKDTDMLIYDHRRECSVACVVPKIPGGVVAIDWSYIGPEDLLTASKKMNSSKGSVAGGRIAIACGDDSIQVVEVCTNRSEKFIDDDEEQLDDGYSTDSDVFDSFMKFNSRTRVPQKKKESLGLGLDISDSALSPRAGVPDAPPTYDSPDLQTMPLRKGNKHTSSHTGLPSLPDIHASVSPRGVSPRGSILTTQSQKDKSSKSPRGTGKDGAGAGGMTASKSAASGLVSQSLPALPGARPSFHKTPAVVPAAVAVTTAEVAPADDDQNTSLDEKEAAMALLLEKAALEGQIDSPFREGVDNHINQFLEDMEAN